LAGLPAAAVARWLELFSGDYFRRCTVVSTEALGPTMVVEGSVLGQDRVRCEIDRATLTPRRFVLDGQRPSMELLLSEYRVASEVVCAGRIEFKSPKGAIVVRFDGIEINASLPPRAFVPSTRAARLP
jgi:hypothetical protein